MKAWVIATLFVVPWSLPIIVIVASMRRIRRRWIAHEEMKHMREHLAKESL